MTAWGRGYYSDAAAAALQWEGCESGESVDPNWLRHLKRATRLFLCAWDIGTSLEEIEKSLDSVLADACDPTARFYPLLVKGWIGSIERLSLADLKVAIDALNGARRIANQQAKEGRAMPGAWAACWFRANAYAELGLPVKAIEDYNIACESVLRETFDVVRSQSHGNSESSHVRHDIKEYLERSLPLAARLWNDRGMFFFDRGDFRSAVDDLRDAREIDPSNPYVHSNLGFVRLSSSEECVALGSLVRAKRLVMEHDPRNRDVRFLYSGRIDLQLALLAYLWLRDKDSLGVLRQEAFAIKLNQEAADDQYVKGLFSDMSACKELLASAATNYLEVKDPSRAFPILLLFLDPLGGRPDEYRRVLWELLLGGSEFIDYQIRHEHSLADYLEEKLP